MAEESDSSTKHDPQYSCPVAIEYAHGHSEASKRALSKHVVDLDALQPGHDEVVLFNGSTPSSKILCRSQGKEIVLTFGAMAL